MSTTSRRKSQDALDSRSNSFRNFFGKERPVLVPIVPGEDREPPGGWRVTEPIAYDLDETARSERTEAFQIFISSGRSIETNDPRERTRIARHVAWVAVLTSPALGDDGPAGQITGIVAFGDSLSDTGNTFLAAGIPAGPVLSGALFQRADLAGIPGRPPGSCGTARPAWRAALDNAWGGARRGTASPSWARPISAPRLAAFLAGNTLSPTQLDHGLGRCERLPERRRDRTPIPVANLAAEITALAAAGGKTVHGAQPSPPRRAPGDEHASPGPT